MKGQCIYMYSHINIFKTDLDSLIQIRPFRILLKTVLFGSLQTGPMCIEVALEIPRCIKFYKKRNTPA